MRNRVTARVLGVTALAYGVGFGLLVVHAIFTFPTREVMPAFQWRWILNSAGARLLENLVPLQVVAIILVFSLLLGTGVSRRSVGRSGRGSGDGKAHGATGLATIRGVLSILVAQTAVVAVLVAVVLPFWRDGADSAIRQTTTARELRARAESAERAGEYAVAIEAYRRYLRIDPSDEHVEQALAEAQTRRAARPSQVLQPDRAPDRRTELRELTGSELLRRSREAYEDEEFFSAHYFAQLALESGEVSRPEAERLISQAWDRIRRIEGDRTEQREREFFRGKRAAYQDLLAGRAVEAYYAFDAIAEEYGADQDVRRYLREAEQLARETAFFLDEIEDVAGFPGYRELVFRNELEPLQTDGEAELGLDIGEASRFHELFFFENLVPTYGGLYATGVEVIRFREPGEIEYHLRSDYAKLRDQHLILRALDRDDPELVFEPEVLHGTLPGEFRHVLPVAAPPELIVELARARSDMSAGSLTGLLQLLRSEHRFGYDRSELRFELLMRLLVPFSFIVLSVAALAAGRRLSGRYLSVPPMLTAVGIVLLPPAAIVAYQVYRYAWQLVVGVLALQMPLAAAAAVLSLLQTVMLFAVLIWAALEAGPES